MAQAPKFIFDLPKFDQAHSPIADIMLPAQNKEVSTENILNHTSLPQNEPFFLVAHDMSSENTPFHKHDFYEIIYVQKGPVTNLIEQEEIYMFTGDIFIMNKESVHALKASNPEAVIINICLRDAFFAEGIFHEFLTDKNPLSNFLRNENGRHYLFYPLAHHPSIRSIIQQIIHEYISTSYQKSFTLLALLLLLLAELAKCEEYSFHGIDKKTLSILDYIENHYADTSLKDIAHVFNYSEAYLSRFIKKHTGLSVSTIITHKKLYHAYEALSQTTYPVEMIAHQVGYKSTSHFYKVFQKHYDKTPDEVRQKH
ncbi:AraC family transcriptional regulator [Listeria costaricensis]|uniref:AraC family transcriptional regulator n=1 Tax=Listeria costaricensis TaxID=2026604 RepID=UPI000C079694|nr:AraC family transcriptional regulator [Listeria costaricensis]